MQDLLSKGIENQTWLGSQLSSIGDSVGYNVRSPDFQRLDQAKRAFINASLRRESGAAIQRSEFENANLQYFPMPGDSPEVLRQKAENRKLVIQGMITQAGRAYQPLTKNTAPLQPKPSTEKNMVYDPKTRTFRPE